MVSREDARAWVIEVEATARTQAHCPHDEDHGPEHARDGYCGCPNKRLCGYDNEKDCGGCCTPGPCKGGSPTSKPR